MTQPNALKPSNVFTSIQQMTRQRWPWLLLAFSAFALELAALYFQYGMDLAPCVMCIYERLAIFGIMFAGLIGAIAPGNLVFRLAGFALWGLSAFWGFLITVEHLDLQMNPSPFKVCPFLPEFPSFMPLHEWIPSLFMPEGLCGDIQWTFMGYSMVQWILASFFIYCLIFTVIAAPTFSLWVKRMRG